MLPALDPYNYTAGHWLRHDILERQARRLNFSFDALQDKILKLSHGAKAIRSVVKHEGGYNRVFAFECDNDERIIARLPTAVAGPASLTTSSEVATITYLQSNTRIPIPKILDWSAVSTNAIGCEYIIMEHAKGVHLHERWETMTALQKMHCVKAIYSNLQEVHDIDFDVYGSLYFANHVTTSTHNAGLGDKFRIGPNCNRVYWDRNVADPRRYDLVSPNQGPWKTLASYCNGLIDTGISRVPEEPELGRPHFRGSDITAHLEVLSAGRRVLNSLVKDQRLRKAATPCLWHPDINKRNIFVSDKDPTIITAFIDWQAASIEPAFKYAEEAPDFAVPMKDPTVEEKEAAEGAALSWKTYDACMTHLLPKLDAARKLNDDFLRPFQYCHRAWTDGAVCFREELIETAQRWEHLGLSGSCPYEVPTGVEREQQISDFKLFTEAVKLKAEVTDFLDVPPDGWVYEEAWESTRERHRFCFEELLKLVEKDRDDPDVIVNREEILRDLWPFDIDWDIQGPCE